MMRKRLEGSGKASIYAQEPLFEGLEKRETIFGKMRIVNVGDSL